MNKILFLNFAWLLASVAAYSPEENRLIHDGDLVEGDIKVLPGQSRGSVPNRLWEKAEFVYDIESSLDDPRAKRVIASAMAAWNSKTNGCIKFIKRTNQAAYASFFRGSGCWSYVGRTGRKQQISLARGCWYHGIVAHEIGHALGFLHEQSRPDRDAYVEIKFENIQSGQVVFYTILLYLCVTSNDVAYTNNVPIGDWVRKVFTTFHFNRCMNCCLGKENNFRKSNSINSLGTPYDYGSIMHYRANAFSKNGQPTIIPKRAGVTIGNRRALSPIDVQQMMLLYKCKGSSTVPPPITTPPPPGTFRCNFNNGMCGFIQDQDDQFDWTRKKGQTQSSNTGPFGDHTGGEKSGNQGSIWLEQDLRLQGSGPRKLIFEGIRGRNFRGDAAIDDVTIYDC
ncbi:Blastula protease 10 [Acropora cervicornis]|uniref:Metalloendopeptidase n=1 Tax=Acropora cervicornis TaxID=6130 RepID=A0AAD9QPL8_ACRCE|nr:Blastula protease 10 [Acropora cervicornis]